MPEHHPVDDPGPHSLEHVGGMPGPACGSARGLAPRPTCDSGGADRIRTDDPLLAKQVTTVHRRPWTSVDVRHSKGLCPWTSVAVRRRPWPLAPHLAPRGVGRSVGFRSREVTYPKRRLPGCDAGHHGLVTDRLRHRVGGPIGAIPDVVSVASGDDSKHAARPSPGQPDAHHHQRGQQTTFGGSRASPGRVRSRGRMGRCGPLSG